ncbi:hypothetical protein PtB15_12B396 [Puccinia triticina]|nr:hypothetical protein PtB15_12B396 [Puccinia triticina]
MSSQVPMPVIGDDLREGMHAFCQFNPSKNKANNTYAVYSLLGESFGDCRNRLLVAAASPVYPPIPEIDGRPWSEPNEQCEIKDNTWLLDLLNLLRHMTEHWNHHIANSFHSNYAAGFPNQMVLVGTQHPHDNAAQSKYSTKNMGDDVCSSLTAGMIAVAKSSPQSSASQHVILATSISLWPSIKDNLSDSTYLPPKPAEKQLRAAAEQVGNPTSAPANLHLRDAQGHFISARSCTKPINIAPPDAPATSSSHPTAVETAANTFFNSILVSPKFNFGFSMPNPLQAHLNLNLQPPTLPAFMALPVSGGNLTPDNPCIQFHTAFLQLSEVLDTFIKSSNPLRHDWGEVCTISNALFAAQKFYIYSCHF